MRPRLLVATISLASGLFAACHDDGLLSPDVVPAGAQDAAWADVGRACRPSSPIRELTSAERAKVSQRIKSTRQDYDAVFAGIARRIPRGFGGVFIADGRFKVHMQDTTRRDATFREFAKFAELRRYVQSNTDLVPARWNYNQLFYWYRYLESELGFFDGLVLRDLDEGKNRISFGVRDAAARADLEARLQALAVPCYLVGIEITGPVSPRLTSQGALTGS